MDYATGTPGTTGFSRCASSFPHDGNTLILDGGDILQGSPFAYWLKMCIRDRLHTTVECPSRLTIPVLMG